MLAEHRLHPSDLIWPMFIADGKQAEEPIASLPGVSRWSVDRLAAKAREARDLGIPCIALFPNTPNALRTDDAREALNPDNLICRAIREIKNAVPEVGILCDVALDPYTTHDGRCHPYPHRDQRPDSRVLSTRRWPVRRRADIVAPST